MRLMRISLALKYRMLFGAAVLLIIGAALAVPWQLMDALVVEQPFRESQRLADAHFRGMGQPQAGAGHGVTGSAHAGEFSLTQVRTAVPPRFVSLASIKRGDPQLVEDNAVDPFVRKALQAFATDPARDTYFPRAARDQAGQRVFRYAHAVRAKRNCLTCHGEGGTAAQYRENELAGIITLALPAEASDQVRLLNRAWLLAAGLLAGILAILLFYIITHRFILAPIEELREVTVRVSDGDLAVRSEVRTGDEFEHLSENLNHMLERLRLSRDELERANKLLDEKLDQMAASNIALYEANRVKSEFLANVTHELRTPLTSIIGFAELLREGPAPVEVNGRTRRYAENILISGRILLEIINDLLDLAKIEAGKVTLNLADVDVRELCETLADFVRPMADKKQLRLELATDGSLPRVRSDRGRIRQILYNLLSNAIKFTPEGGLVTLGARSSGPEAVFLWVHDSGPGIAPEHHELIFEKFRQIDQSETREHHGTGLGLAIAKELTHILGGRLGVESKLGEGATFWVELPLRSPEKVDLAPISLV